MTIRIDMGDPLLDTKVFIEALPIGGDDISERRIFSEKGEMAQVLNRTNEVFKQLVYWELDSSKSGQERGHHYHKRKTEHFYVLTGELELTLRDLEGFISKKVMLKAGHRVAIGPKVAHAFRAVRYSQVLEFSPEPYDATDTHSYKLVV